MKVARLAFCLALVATGVVGCGPTVPSAGNYATITGRVLDSATGQPVAGAVVSVSVVSSAPTGADGVYHVYPIPTGPYSSIAATAPNYQPYFNNGGGTLAPGQTLSFDITMTHS